MNLFLTLLLCVQFLSHGTLAEKTPPSKAPVWKELRVKNRKLKKPKPQEVPVPPKNDDLQKEDAPPAPPIY